jgi:hypothetical protein
MSATSRRRLAVSSLVGVGVVALLVFCVATFFRPPRTAWGSWGLDPTCPPNHRAYQVYGASWSEDLRLRLTGTRVVHIPDVPPGGSVQGWPRLSGRTRPIAAYQNGETEIEFRPP